MPQGLEVEVEGTVAPGFEGVRAAFAANFVERGEVGAAFCALIDGEVVVDVWGGLADRRTARPWRSDTLSVVWSTTKGVVAACFLLLVDRGQLDLDRRVAHYWPEFARDGKEEVTVRDLLDHRAGLPTVEAPLEFADFEDPERVARACERQAPLWRPGSTQGYGPIAWGVFAGALFRKVTGEGLGGFLARELAEPLCADVHLGVRDSRRVATLYPAGLRRVGAVMGREMWGGTTLEGRLYRRLLLQRRSFTARAFRSQPTFPRLDLELMNDPALHRLELPWANVCASAHGLARLYAPFACGGAVGGRRVCRTESLGPPQSRRSWTESDAVVLKPLGFSQGFLKDELTLFSPNAETFGHPGMGGSFAFADPTERLSFAYVMNRMDVRIRPERSLALSRALYACLQARRR